MMTDSNIAKARSIISRCETDLARTLSDGERRDLLVDNTSWGRATIVAVVSALQPK